ncbi:hypothetical protein B0H13DRAFT_1879326 [Mycena leptocephala]|nr:hypothetical protein B0H13DRAFT_1879326 [Mycena leptocephala]
MPAEAHACIGKLGGRHSEFLQRRRQNLKRRNPTGTSEYRACNEHLRGCLAANKLVSLASVCFVGEDEPEADASLALAGVFATAYGNTDWTASVQRAGRSAVVIGGRALTLSVLGPQRQIRESPQAQAFFAKTWKGLDVPVLQLLGWIRTRWASLYAFDLLKRRQASGKPLRETAHGNTSRPWRVPGAPSSFAAGSAQQAPATRLCNQIEVSHQMLGPCATLQRDSLALTHAVRPRLWGSEPPVPFDGTGS